MSGNLPVAYSILREGLTLDIALVESDRLLLHEETIPSSLSRLKDRIRRDGVLKSPVIVDRDTLVILDGMHRVKALRELECRYTCACLVDYTNSEIKLERWCRAIDQPLRLCDLDSQLEKIGVTVSDEEVGSTSGEITLLLDDGTYRVKTPKKGIRSSLEVVVELEFWLVSEGYKVTHETERDVSEKYSRGNVGAVIYPPMIEKSQVIDVARSGQVLAFKSTRHVIPARPIGVNVPLSLLQDPELSASEVNRILSKNLYSKRLRRIPPGTLIGDRRYEEEMYVFEEG